jgi:16S rRNA (guanine(966)-N(2))-methyltransferase RsmD
MRVISGIAKGRKLTPPQDRRVRPTSDRIKEALFSIIVSHKGKLSGWMVLDLFSGTGNLGIEALSRGAGEAVFIDKHRDSVSLIRKNLQDTGLEHQARILAADVFPAIGKLAGQGQKFRLILADPPYDQGFAAKLLATPATSELLDADSLLVIETSSREILPEHAGDLKLYDSRTYGDTAITFYTLSY